MVVAEREIGSARILAAGGAAEDAAFLVQQAAEKTARAVLLSEGIQFGPVHSLGQMGAKLAADHKWRSTINELDRLSSWATKYRYPLESGRLPNAPNKDELQASIDEVSVFIADVREWLG